MGLVSSAPNLVGSAHEGSGCRLGTGLGKAEAGALAPSTRIPRVDRRLQTRVMRSFAGGVGWLSPLFLAGSLSCMRLFFLWALENWSILGQRGFISPPGCINSFSLPGCRGWHEGLWASHGLSASVSLVSAAGQHTSIDLELYEKLLAKQTSVAAEESSVQRPLWWGQPSPPV